MSLTYYKKGQLIFTGAHDGSLIAWTLENNQSKVFFHDLDKSCVSVDYVKDAKSVDCLMVMKKRRVLLSVSADQYMRFWDLSELQSQPSIMYADHAKEDSVSAVATTMDNNYLLTADTSGNLKLWNFTDYPFKKSQ